MKKGDKIKWTTRGGNIRTGIVVRTPYIPPEGGWWSVDVNPILKSGEPGGLITGVAHWQNPVVIGEMTLEDFSNIRKGVFEEFKSSK